MDELTIQLVRLLQGVEEDEAALDRVAVLLPEVRSGLRDAADGDMLGEIVDLLERWAAREADDQRAAAGLRAAAEVAGDDLADWERAADLYDLALQRYALDRAAVDRLEVLLDEHGEDARLEVVLMRFAQALDAARAEPGERGRTLRKLGKLRAERLLDIDTAIAAYEGAVEVEPTPEVLAELADLFERRADLGDDEEAAKLYYRLGGLVEGEPAIAYLRRALHLVPDHEDALTLLQSHVPAKDRISRLGEVYEAFVSVAPEGPKVAAVRAELQALRPREHAGPEAARGQAQRPPEPPLPHSLSPVEVAEDAPPSRRRAASWRARVAFSSVAVAAGLLLLFAVGGEKEQKASASSDASGDGAAQAAPAVAAPAPVTPPEPEPEPAPAAPSPAPPPLEAVDRADTAPAAVELVEELTSVHGSGEPERAALIGSIRAALPAIDRCYAHARERLPKLRGRLVYAWTIDASGSTRLIKHVRGTIRDRQMQRCVGAALRAARFGNPLGRPVRVTAPLIFRTG
jgi:tetratricopeptide (TPR) repeat protein